MKLLRGRRIKKDENAINAPTQREHQIDKNITPPEPTAETQGELAYKESTLPVSKTKVNKEIAMILYNYKKNDLVDLTTTEQDSEDDDDLDKQTLSKRFKIMHPNLNIPVPLMKRKQQQPEPTPPRDTSKGKGKEVATKEPKNELISYMEEGGSNPNMPIIKSFITLKGTLSKEYLISQHKELKRLADLKEQEKKSEEELKKLQNPATFKAQALKWKEHEEKKAKMFNEFNKCIYERTNPFPITKTSYVVNSSTATMRITRDKDPLNLTVYLDFRLRMLGFSEWLEIHALVSKKSGKSYDVLLQSLKAKFQWVLNQAKRLGIPPPPALATFGMTAEDKKRKRTKFLKEVFVTEDIRVDGMGRNMIPPPGVIPIQGLVINKPESGIFFINGNTDIGFQRENEFHLAPTTKLIRIQNQIKVDSKIADEMFRKMIYVIEARSDCIKAREIVEKNLDNLG
ncbi:hypothetical protein Tco_0752475 [Tanacetum coccineum]|uniref:Uncharacterized protein n=1 Tax=Tanacetum coccineum TaxID=301880 RepID=A0ABQ4Z6Z0_9ASTR